MANKSRCSCYLIISKSYHVFIYLLAITALTKSEEVLRHPTRVPGSSHLVARTEFPYLYWRPSPRPYTPVLPSTVRQEPTAYPYFYGESLGENVSDTTTWQALPIQLPDDLVGAFDEKTTRSTTTQTPPYPTQASPQYGRHPGMTERPHLFYPERLYTTSRSQDTLGQVNLNTATSHFDYRYPSHENTAVVTKDSENAMNEQNSLVRPSQSSNQDSSLRRQNIAQQPRLPRPPVRPDMNNIPGIRMWPFNSLNRNRQGGINHRPVPQKHQKNTNTIKTTNPYQPSTVNEFPNVDYDYQSFDEDDYYDYDDQEYYDYQDYYEDPEQKYHPPVKRPSNDNRHPVGPSDDRLQTQTSHHRPDRVQQHAVTHLHDNIYKYQIRPQYTGDVHRINPPKNKRPGGQPIQFARPPPRRPRPRPWPRPNQQTDPNNIDRFTNLDSATSSVLVPGGMLVVAVALALFYFNFVWYPTPVVTARLIQMISNSAPKDFFEESQQVAVEKMYEVFRSLETEYTQEPDLWTPACKLKLVCQVHKELPGLWRVTQTIGAMASSTLAVDPQMSNSFLVFLEAAMHGAEDSDCSRHYNSCQMEQIPVLSSLQKAMDTGLESVTEIVYS